ncbi:MAG: hypothetical protein FJY20_00885 [Bacteroidetes bacterium]|nr:hypothetical protein [Bacteroidota bacterium]
MRKHIFFLLAMGIILVTGCQKELSFEQPSSPAEGSLQDDASGDCLPKTVNGAYAVGQALTASNTITVAVSVTKTGTYTVYTDTVNGYFFRVTGTFTNLGTTNVTLRGNGTPFAAGINNFVVTFDTTVCDIQVTVTQPGVGTLAGAPNACAPITVNGAYSPGASMTAAHNAVVTVNVTTAGAFNITTDTVAGIWFTFSGALGLGTQTVPLQAQGAIPASTTAGAKTFTVKLGASRCTFDVQVTAAATGTVDCTNPVFSGTFTVGVAMTAANTVQINVTVATIGAYTITTDTVNGVWFNASGNFTATGPATLTLTGNGTPVNSGPFTYTVRWGTSTCTFSCTFNPPPDYFPRTTNSNWSYEWDDDPVDSLYRNVIAATHSAAGNTFNIFMFDDGTGPDSSGYYRRNGGDYFEWFDAGAFIGYNPPELWAQYIFLKDNVALNTNWKSQSFSGFIGPTPLTIRFSYTIKLKDGPLSFSTSTGNMNFTNVIAVEEKYEAEIAPGVWQDLTDQVGYFKSYYARNIGLVLLEYYPDSAATIPDNKMELRRHQVF